MHFTTLFLLKNKELVDISKMEIEEEFGKRFCNNCGTTRPMYHHWCDWFQIGGRWNDKRVLKAKKGLIGENGIGDDYKKPTYSIVEIKDLEKINEDMIYAITTKSRIYPCDLETEKYNELMAKIKSKQIKGVIALIDCHD